MRSALLGMILILVAAASPVASSPAADRVTLSVAQTLSSAPYFLAIERGHFARFGIQVTLERVSDPVVFATLNAGILDVAFVAPRPGVFELVNRGGRIRAVSGGIEVATRCTATAFVASQRRAQQHPRLTTADLRGARVGVIGPSDGSLFHFMVVKWLERGGLSEQDVTFVRLPFPAQVEAMARGTVDAALLGEPYLTAVLTRGAGVILDRAQAVAPGMPVTLTFVGPRLLSRPGLVGRVLAAYLLGVRDYMAPDARRNPEILRILAEQLGQSEDTIRKGCWQPARRDGRVNVAALETLHRWQVAGGFVSQPVAMARFVDERYLREAWQLLEASGVRVR